MDRIANSWTLATVGAFVIFFLCPMKSWCDEDTYRSLFKNTPEYLPSDFEDMKRFSDIDYDSFVGLMGRSADRRDTTLSRKNRRQEDDVFIGFLGRSLESREEHSQPRRVIFINQGRLRFQPIV
ncbi:tachykinin-3b isoform 2-T2 [Polymixia lowei]